MSSAEPPDVVVHARWVLPVDPPGLVLEQHSVVIRAGRIESVLGVACAPVSWPIGMGQRLKVIVDLITGRGYPATDRTSHSSQRGGP